MFNKLRSNFQLSNLIVRILFVVTFVFSSWQDMLAATKIVLLSGELSQSLVIPVMLLSSIISAVIIMMLIPVLVNLFLNIIKVYSVPRAEYVLLVMLFFDIGFFACGLLNLVNLFTPLFLTWGSVLFPFISSLGCVIAFYKVTAKLYFNDVTRVYYFKVLAIAYLAIALVMGVLA